MSKANKGLTVKKEKVEDEKKYGRNRMIKSKTILRTEKKLRKIEEDKNTKRKEKHTNGATQEQKRKRTRD